MPNLIRIPFLRGNSAQNNAYRGAVGEVTIDVDGPTLRVHDGEQFGGTRLLTENDLASLDGIGSGYIKRSSVFSKNVVYRAEAVVGTVDTAAAWKIRKLTITYGSSISVVETWANGNQSFTNKWSDRLTYTYS